MNPEWSKVAEYAHRYNGKDFTALAFHTAYHNPGQLLPNLPGPAKHGWALKGDFDRTPVSGQGDFRSLKLALAYADSRFNDLRENMKRTGKTAAEVKEAISTIRQTNDEAHVRKVYRQKLGLNQKPTKAELAILMPTPS